jgi:hypothetical protein
VNLLLRAATEQVQGCVSADIAFEMIISWVGLGALQSSRGHLRSTCCCVQLQSRCGVVSAQLAFELCHGLEHKLGGFGGPFEVSPSEINFEDQLACCCALQQRRCRLAAGVCYVA